MSFISYVTKYIKNDDGSSIFTIEMDDVMTKCMEIVSNDVEVWISNAIENRARIEGEKVYKSESDKHLEGGTMPSNSTKSSLILAHEFPNLVTSNPIVTDLENTNTQLETTRIQLENTRVQLEGDLQTTRTDLTETQTQLQTTQTQIGDTQTQLGDTQTQLGDTQTQLETTRTELEHALEAEKVKTKNLESRIAFLETAVASLIS